MKKIYSLLLILLAFVFACKKESKNNDPTPSNNNNTTSVGRDTVIASIDGQVWTFLNAEARIAGRNVLLNGVGFLPGAAQSSNIKLTFSDSILTSYSLSGASFSEGDFLSEINSGPAWTSSKNGSGTVQLTSLDRTNKTISGTFNFTGYEMNVLFPSNNTSKNITGSFSNVPYYVTNQVPYLKVKIDGVFDSTALVRAIGWGSLGETRAYLNNNNAIIIESQMGGTGTFPINCCPAVGYLFQNSSLTNGLFSTSGSCTIDSAFQFYSTPNLPYLHELKESYGRFNFIATDGSTTHSITEGYFCLFTN